MIKVGLPSALIYGSSFEEGQHRIFSDAYHEERLQEAVIVEAKKNSMDFFGHFSTLNPDLIITIGGTKASWEYIAKHSDHTYIFTKWIHLDEQPNNTQLANLIAKQSTNWACDSLDTVYNSTEKPYFSIFTGAYKTDKDRIYRSYNSLANQTYPNWEWTIVDDSPEGYEETWTVLNELANQDYRVKIHRILPVSGGNIGLVKNRAASLSNGNYLIEMDHDDALISDCLDELKYAVEQYPDAGFFYTNVAEPYEDGEMRKYSKVITPNRDEWYGNPQNGFQWGYGGHEWVIADGKRYLSHYYANINPKTIRFNIGMPNHARIWKRDVYNEISKHNKFISVTDDFELIIRTFLKTTMVHVPKMLYLQYNNRNSTVDNNATDINRKARLIRDFYDKQIHERIVQLGKYDFEWNEELQRSNPLQNDMQDLQFDDENALNEIAMIKKEENKKPTIAFATMCKNEEAVIRGTLDSLAPHIDYLVFVDTGSTDGTVAEVEKFMSETGIPGEIHVDEWIDFDVNKTQMMNHAYGKADYIFHLDSHMHLQGDFNFTFEDAGLDAYDIEQRRGTATFPATILWKGDLRWRFIGVRHTIMKCEDKPEGYSRGRVENCWIQHGAGGMGSRTTMDPNKYGKDAKALEDQFWRVISNDPDDIMTRSVFYAAQSWFDQKDWQKSLNWYTLYTRLQGTWFEETFESYLRIAKCRIQLGQSIEQIEPAIRAAIDIEPERSEPYALFARHLFYMEGSTDGHKQIAYQFMKKAVECDLNEVKNKYILFVDDMAYGKYLYDDFSVMCYHTGNISEGMTYITKIFNDIDFEVHKPRLEANLNFFKEKLVEQNEA